MNPSSSTHWQRVGRAIIMAVNDIQYDKPETNWQMFEDKVKNKSCPDILTSLNGESSPGTEALTFRLRVSLGDRSVRVISSAGPQYTHLVPENKMARIVMDLGNSQIHVRNKQTDVTA